MLRSIFTCSLFIFLALSAAIPESECYRRSLEQHANIFTAVPRHEGHETDTIAERAANDVLVGYGVGNC
jgi:hypothetical protein